MGVAGFCGGGEGCWDPPALLFQHRRGLRGGAPSWGWAMPARYGVTPASASSACARGDPGCLWPTVFLQLSLCIPECSERYFHWHIAVYSLLLFLLGPPSLPSC